MNKTFIFKVAWAISIISLTATVAYGATSLINLPISNGIDLVFKEVLIKAEWLIETYRAFLNFFRSSLNFPPIAVSSQEAPLLPPLPPAIHAFDTSSYSLSLPEAFQESAKKVFKTCKDVKPYMECLGEEFAKIIGKRGFAFVHQALLYYQELDPKTRNCHVVAHEIIQSLTRGSPESWKEILQGLDPDMCGGGFMHGALEIAVGDNTNVNVDGRLFDVLCEQIASKYLRSCVHILGHILFLEKRGSLEASLKVCSEAKEEYIFDCYGGVFMEDSFRTNFPDHGLGSTPVRGYQWFDRQIKRCRTHSDSGVIEAGCFYDLAEVAVQTHDFSITKAYDICMSARTKAAQKQCYIRASYIIATTPTKKIDEMDFKGLCALGSMDRSVQTQCVIGTLHALMSSSLLYVTRAVKLCEALDEPYHSACFEELNAQVNRRAALPKERARFCSALPEPYQSHCIGTAASP